MRKFIIIILILTAGILTLFVFNQLPSQPTNNNLSMDDIAENFFQHVINGEEYSYLFDSQHQETYQQSPEKEENYILHRLLRRDDIYWVDEWTRPTEFIEPNYQYQFERHYGAKNYENSKGTVIIVSNDNENFHLLYGSGLSVPSNTPQFMFLSTGSPPKYELININKPYGFIIFAEGNPPIIVKQDEQICPEATENSFSDARYLQ